MKIALLSSIMFLCLIQCIYGQSPDETFGNNGLAQIANNISTSGFDRSHALQPDGKIVSAGSFYNANSNYDFAVTRSNANGTPDNGFGTNGVLTLDLFGQNEYAYAIAVQSDGKILVSGYRYYYQTVSCGWGCSTTYYYYDMVLIRLNSNGSLDNSFDGDGIKIIDLYGANIGEALYSMALQSDGKIILSGYANSSFAVIRLNIDGSFDGNFNGTGYNVFLVGSGSFAYTCNTTPGGKIIVGGYSYNGSYSDMAVAVLNSNGTLDNSFDGDGKQTVSINTNYSYCYSVAGQTDGKIVMGGGSNGIDEDITVVRLNANGSLDNNFGTVGIKKIDFNNNYDDGRSVLLQSDGKIVVSGLTYDNVSYNFAVARLNTDGSFDNSFGSSGKYSVDNSGISEFGYSSFFQPDGRLVIAGNAGGYMAYERILLPPPIATTVASTDLCAGSSVNVSFTTSGFYNSGNIFTAQLSNPTGSFNSPTIIGSIAATASSNINATIPANTAAGTQYRIRVVSDNPSSIGTDNGSDITVNEPISYYKDADGDGFGDAAQVVSDCSPPDGYVTDNTDCDDTKLLYADNDGDGYGSGPPVACGVDNNTDCNDADASVHSPQTYYADNDGDGFGDPNNSISECSSTAPSGYVTDNTDCDDSKLLYADNDGDGYGAGSPVACGVDNNTDCNDADVTVHAPQTYYADNDGDGFGDPNNSISECSSTAPSGYVTDNTDCDDSKLLYADSDGDGYGAGSPVACGVDNNTDCNDADGTVHTPQTYYADNDGDGFGDVNNSISECSSTPPSGYVTDNTDCDDTKLLYADNDGDGYGAGSPVACGVDNNTDCNDADGTVHTPQTYYADNDGDGFGDANNSISVCASTAPSSYVTDNTDCDDRKLLYVDNDGDGYGAGSPVACGVDNNTDCNDGDITVNTPQTYYADNDGDGFGDANNSISACSSTAPSGYVTDNTDCDDTKLLYADSDGDGYGAGSPVACGVDNNTDCNDADGTVHPGAAEICGNGIDDNCDGHIDEGCNTPVTISIADVSIVEGNNGLKAMKFIVSLSKAATQKVTVNFRTQNGTALAGSDYALTLGSVAFKKGLTQKVIKIIISGDRQVEPDETFTVELSNPKNATIANGSATGTILNDDFSSLTTSPEITTGDNKPVKPNYTVKIWPNPVRDLLTVQLVGVSNDEVSLQIQDIQGRVLKQGKIKPFAKLAQQQIDVSGFANGVYLLVIVSDTGGIQSKKIIVDHSH